MHKYAYKETVELVLCILLVWIANQITWNSLVPRGSRFTVTTIAYIISAHGQPYQIRSCLLFPDPFFSSANFFLTGSHSWWQNQLYALFGLRLFLFLDSSLLLLNSASGCCRSSLTGLLECFICSDNYVCIREAVIITSALLLNKSLKNLLDMTSPDNSTSAAHKNCC